MSVSASKRADSHFLTEEEAEKAQQKLRELSQAVDSPETPKPAISYITQGLHAISASRRITYDVYCHPAIHTFVAPLGFQLDVTSDEEDDLGREIGSLQRWLRAGANWPYPAYVIIAYLDALLNGKLFFRQLVK